MPAVYDRSPLRIKMPEDNGGGITNVDMFPGYTYFSSASDVVSSSNIYSTSVTSKLNVYGSFRSPSLVRYISSINAFSYTFFKGIYLYNPSIEKDKLNYECTRNNIFFSINGGSVFSLPNLNVVFYETSPYLNYLNDKINLSKVEKTSSNNNVKISISLESNKNVPLPYFNVDGSLPRLSGTIRSRVYSNASAGVVINELLPGDYIGMYLKIESLFNPASLPFDFSFFNLRYENSPNQNNLVFSDRDNIPGAGVDEFSSFRFYTQSMVAKFETRLDTLNKSIDKTVNLMYDNYPPFFSDYREE